ncbi:hypothetical protein FO441_00875 [Salinicoccus cyprini]|uniref:Mannosyl-glycoprotein endo-beta-N-acetylglucosamidase-like domain-containing protein n=1 Tax=Salinicoccus cyprini TaxID=2493691 RepID=A0A558AX77_9STAP|nr:N-acetylglucosaminidase [Salinicoccus cyprini]TVT28865.1 hypothetical protein FO441_00875 [Salinicoccus cyprini]
MKYKNRLIVPTLVTLSLLGISAQASADETDGQDKIGQQQVSTKEYISNTKESEKISKPVIEESLSDVVEEASVPDEHIKAELESTEETQQEIEADEVAAEPVETSIEETRPESNVSESKPASETEFSKSKPASATDEEESVAQSETEPIEESNTSESVKSDHAVENESVEAPVLKAPGKSSQPENKTGNDQQNSDDTKAPITSKPTEKSLDTDEDRLESEVKSETKDESVSLETPVSKDTKEKNVLKTSNKNDEIESADANKEITENGPDEEETEPSKETQENKKETTEPEATSPESKDEEKLQKRVATQRFSLMSDVSFLRMDTSSTTPDYSVVSYAAKIGSDRNSGLRSPVTSKRTVSADFLEDQTIFIERKADYQGEIFYRVHSSYEGAMQGWMKSNDLRLFNLSEAKKHSENFRVGTPNHYLLTDPWGSKEQQVKRLGAYEDESFKSEKVLTLGAHTYYYGKIGNDHGWIEKRKLHSLDIAPVYKNVSYAAKLKSKDNSGLRSPVTSQKSVSADFLLNQTVFIERQADYAGETFYQVHSSYEGAMQGWMKSIDLNKWDLSEEKVNNASYTLQTRTGGLLEDPWGMKEQYINTLNDYKKGTSFQAQKTVDLGALTFYYGKLGNDYGWIQNTKVQQVEPSTPSPVVNTVKYKESLNEVLDTQMSLRSKPQAWVSGGGWRNATREEVRYNLDPANHQSDTWDYTFLNLNQAQNISSYELNNKLLSGKGTLHNQGSAFLRAANTHGVNEVYLISHALHETGNGQSQLARGVRLDANGNISSNGKLYYNMYGIAAYDHNPILAGARYAQQMGWDTPAKAVIGGAQFISSGYFNRNQTTLYAMRWNPMNPGTYQYATDVNWAYATARNLKNYYDQLGIRGQYYTRYTF